MIYCPVCSTANRSGSKFCNECGASLNDQGLICPECASPNLAASQFCRSCGQPLSEQETPSHGAPWSDIDDMDLESELPSFEADVPTDAAFLSPVEEPGVETSTGELAFAALQGGDSDQPLEAIFTEPYSGAEAMGAAPQLAGGMQPSGTLPDWLELAEPAQSPPVLPAWLDLDEPSASGERLLPDWTDTADENIMQEAGSPVKERQALPSWLFLREQNQPESISLPGWLELPDDNATEHRSLPDWLDTVEPARSGVLPDWLLELDEPSLSEPLPSSSPSLMSLDEATTVEQASKAAVKAPPMAIEIVPPTISLARPFRGILASSKAASAPVQGQSYEALFADILQPKHQTAAAVSPLGAQRFRLLSLLLVVIIAIPLIVPPGINLDTTRETSELFNTVQALPPAANILITFDWTPGTDEEMAPIAEALIRHLIKRKANMVAVSLIPEGGKLAQRVLDRSLLDARGYEYGNQIVNLGYLPGGEAAIRSMMADLPASYGVDHFGIPIKDLPLLKGIRTLQSADLVVILSSEPDVLTSWVTQVSSAFKGVRMVAGLSSALLPWSQPYSSASEASQLKGKVVGIRGAAEYELATGDHRVAYSAVDAQSLGSVFLALVIVAGNLAYLRSKLKKPKGEQNQKPFRLRS